MNVVSLSLNVTHIQEHDVYVQPINYPTVPKGTERLRLTPTPLHDNAMMSKLVDAMVETFDTLGIERKFEEQAKIAKTA